MKKNILILLCLASLWVKAQQQIAPELIQPKMQWFADAKFGIFIHEGIYAVQGVDESWSFHNKKISHQEYMKQLSGFTMKNYHPEEWAELIKQSGARYAVITTKHHDGVALYDTKCNGLSVVKKTPAKRDIIQPFFEALRERNIKCGAYFSLIDWSHPDYPQFLKDSNRYEISNDKARWEDFQSFYFCQLNEINEKFKPDLWWFDGDWEHSANEWESDDIRHLILSGNENSIINGRLNGYGDYDTPEQNIPVTKPNYKWWELCMTSNDNWGFQHDSNWKSPYEVLCIFTDVISNGGNLLLDIGPDAEGNIPKEQVHLLKEIGAWNERHSEAIFNTLGGLPQGHFYGPSTLSKDSTTLFLFLQGKTNGEVTLKGLNNHIQHIEVLGQHKALSHHVVGKISWSKIPGVVFIQVPEEVNDPYITVLKIKLDGPLSYYRGQGGLN